MAMRSLSLVPSTVTRSLVCVDEVNSTEISGLLYNPFLPEPVSFRAAYDIVDILENFFDNLSFPQATYDYRAFNKQKVAPTSPKKNDSEVCRYMSDEIFNDVHGKKATFVIQVQFRQNATWQGTITWTEEKKTQRFRSTLEMIKLMDNALSRGEHEDTGIWE